MCVHGDLASHIRKAVKRRKGDAECEGDPATSTTISAGDFAASFPVSRAITGRPFPDARPQKRTSCGASPKSRRACACGRSRWRRRPRHPAIGASSSERIDLTMNRTCSLDAVPFPATDFSPPGGVLCDGQARSTAASIATRGMTELERRLCVLSVKRRFYREFVRAVAIDHLDDPPWMRRRREPSARPRRSVSSRNRRESGVPSPGDDAVPGGERTGVEAEDDDCPLTAVA